MSVALLFFTGISKQKVWSEKHSIPLTLGFIVGHVTMLKCEPVCYQLTGAELLTTLNRHAAIESIVTAFSPMPNASRLFGRSQDYLCVLSRTDKAPTVQTVKA